TIPAGTYYVGWIIDSESTVSESNENNNTAYKTGYQLIVPVAVNTGTLNDYNPYDIPIEDNGAVATSDLYLSGAPSGSIITKITLYFEIIHTYPGDLDIWLTYYDGGWHDYYIYHYNDLGSDDNVIYSGVINFYNGISPNQTWYLSVQDRMIGDSGYINYFELWIDYEY
ncbi:MAG: hypothetical protein JXN64_12620, partial [Spirochaetes bacterium]|nr:hypothetical protein [Spirochaetota bacterium]